MKNPGDAPIFALLLMIGLFLILRH